MSLQPIVLIERGGCNFDQKMMHAEMAGYSAAVVFNNEQTEALFTSEWEEGEE